MTKKIFASILMVSLVAILACLVIVTGVLYDHLTSIQKTRMKAELGLASTGTEQNGIAYLKAVDADGYRLTLIDPDGTVLFDSSIDAGSMENHADRTEFIEALKSGSGESQRYSATLTERTLYYAERLDDGSVLRISMQQLTILTLLLGMLQPILVVCVIVLILAGVLASRMAKRIVKPLNELDLEHPLDCDAYDELSPLIRRINQLHRQVDAQLSELHRKKEEFEQITGSMREGLVLLGEQGSVLSINNAAMQLFHVDTSCIGADFLTVERSREISEAIRLAMTSGHNEVSFQRDGREYQLEISRIETDANTVGTVLLAFDVTDKVFAERNRREFTANVSHELKTPLQSMMGSAELIENGLVKPDDLPRFVGRIRSEAARLVTLIEDIIRLSQLDEKSELPFEPVDLFSLATELKEQLQYAADEKSVALHLVGSETTVYGVRKLLGEALFNVFDNAIKYNRVGGTVDVTVSQDGSDATVTVRDTGIGIPPEHIERVFERFYRVDQSHSKESGGTGLGLSIVKHAIAYHGGRVKLESVSGEGSVFTLIIPLDGGKAGNGQPVSAAAQTV